MAYPYLPVNPCCTDVVLNDPCGCSSTINNVGCGQSPCGTNVILSSNVLYNGPVLDCIIAEPCDTLNVILQKIDQIICNLLTQINTLNIQVHNITTQIINIEGDIVDINNQLGTCCTTTTSTSSTSTTTSTTTIHPCESFSLNNTGVDPVAVIITDCDTQVEEAIVLLPGDTNICVVTDSPLNVPGTVIVVPNGPCGPTTTTTTTLPACNCITFSNTDVDGHTIGYDNCLGTTFEVELNAHQVFQVCGSNPTVSDPFVEISVGAACISEVCPPPSTSTTTSTTTAIPCECLTFTNTDESAIDHDISYTDCFGDFIETTISAGQVINVCGCCGLASSELVIISVGANCIDNVCPTTTTTTTTCNNPNVITNGTFDTDLNGWTDSIPPDWTWSITNGGSAHYTGRDEHGILFQNSLTPGVTYDITFNLWCANSSNIIKVLAGTTEYSITGVSGYEQVNIILTCVGTSLFGFQGYDELGVPYDTIYINDVNVSVHCPQFTTTTSTTNNISTTTTTHTTCSFNHPYNINLVTNVTTGGGIPFTGSLLEACAAVSCLNSGGCLSGGLIIGYWDQAVPSVGDGFFANPTDCLLPSTNGWFAINITGAPGSWQVVHMVNSIIESYPTC